MKGDTMHSARAVFLPPADARRKEATALGEHFAVVPVETAAEVSSYCRHNHVEVYASWRVGVEADPGLPLLSAASLRAVRAAEERSRIVVDRGRLARIVAAARARGRRIVFTNGVFDLVHVGHLRLLARARALGDVLIVAINSDDSARRIKGPDRPVVPQFARAEALTSLRCVDWCCIFPEDDPRALLTLVKPDVLAKGSDYGPCGVVGADIVRRAGGTVQRLPLVQGVSTSATIGSIRHRAGKEK